MDEILKVVAGGVVRLVGLIDIWAGAKTPEEREAIKSKALELTMGLDAYYTKKDAEDKAAQDALQAKIDATVP
jgi:hypothetical protein